MHRLDLRKDIDHLIASGRQRAAIRSLTDLWNQDRTVAGAEFITSRYEALREGLSMVPFRLAILRNCTLEPLVPLVRAGAFVNGIDLTVHLGGYNTYVDEMHEKNSAIHRFAPNAAILAVEVSEVAPELWWGYSDLTPAQRRDVIGRTVKLFSGCVAAFRKDCSASLIIHSAKRPHAASLGILDAQRADGQSAAVEEINRELRQIAAGYKGVYLLDYDALASRYGRLRWRDESKWSSVRLPVAAAYLKHLAEEWLRYLIPLAGRMAKVLAVDLDNTLWGGVVGEDGFDRLQIGTQYPAVAYHELQRVLLDFYRRGILLAVCSKNNFEEAIEVLEKHPGLLLRPQHFAALRINWNDKVQSLREIAAELNVGIDALAFLDDSSLEREEVREMLPQVTVIELPPNPADFAQAVRDCPVFERLHLSDEDLQRAKYYSHQRQRAELEHSLSSLEEFYYSLEQEIKISRVESSTIARVAQLTQKTNQFNLTTRRYTEQEIVRMIACPDLELYSLHAKDRFGDVGLVGVAVTRSANEIYEIEVFLLSCRAIGRTLETAFLSYLVRRARELGASRVQGWFLPTAKNEPAQGFYSKHGFRCETQTESGSLWALDLDHAEIACPKWIHMRVPEERS